MTEHAGNNDASQVGPEWAGIAAFLGREVEAIDGPVEIVATGRPLGGASWETFFVDYRVDPGATQRVVIRRAPATGPMAPYEVAKDAMLFGVLADSDVPVPRLLAWTEDPNVFERPFLVASWVAGEAPDLSQVERWPRWKANRVGLGEEMIRCLAALQRVRWQETDLASVLGGVGDARTCARRVVNRYLDPLFGDAKRLDVGVPVWREIGAWLRDSAPDLSEDELVIVHGDYRFGNLIWQDDEIVAVLDWERALLGGPMQDLGFLCMPLSRRRQPEIMGKVLSFDELARSYEKESGRTIDFVQLQYYAVLWQFLEGVNTTRALLQERAPMILSGVLVQPNLIARQTLELIDHVEAGRAIL